MCVLLTVLTALTDLPALFLLLLCIHDCQVHDLCLTRPGFFWSLYINSCIAYLVNLTNFLVTKYTSALTLQVNPGT